MSETITMLEKRTFPVTIGALTLEAESWELTAARQYAQTGGATGDCFLTNSAMKAATMVLRGRIGFADTPGEMVGEMERVMREQTLVSFEMRGMSVSGARVGGYWMKEEAGETQVACEVRLIITNQITA